MAEKAPKISTHAPKHKTVLEKQSSFIHKKGEQLFFGGQQAKTSQAFIQPKLQVSKPGDPFEQEADETADKVMRMSEPASVSATTPPDGNVQLKCSKCEEEEKLQKKEEEEVQPKLFVNSSGALVQRQEEEDVQAKTHDDDDVQRKEEEDEHLQPALNNGANILMRRGEEEDIHTSPLQRVQDRGPPSVSRQFEHNLRSNNGGGRPLDNSTQTFMERRFNADFSDVKVHTGNHATELSSSINAQAFTHGNNIYFNSGKFNPNTGTGKHLLAHELTHTIQQGASKSVRPFLSTKLNAQASAENTQEEEDHIAPYIQRKESPGKNNNSTNTEVRPELKRAVAHARSQVGKVDAGKKNADGTRSGWERLADYFKTAMGEDKVIPEGGAQKPGSILEKDIKYSDTVMAPPPNVQHPTKDQYVLRDKMPSWCGIFVFWSLNKGGVPMPKWGIGGTAVKLKAAYPPNYVPHAGDIAYFNTNSHYAIVEKTEPENPSPKERKNVKVSTVNGNTTGENNLGGGIQVKTHSLSHWDGFFNPLFGIMDKMPANPADVTDAELQQILAGAAVADAGRNGGTAASSPAAIKPYTPASIVPPGMPVAPVKTGGGETAAPEEAAKAEAGAPVTGETAEKSTEQPAPKTPEEDPAYQEVIKKSAHAKTTQKVHGAPEDKAAAAQNASEIPKDIDVNSQAQFHQVGAMNVQEAKPFNKEDFKSKLMDRVKEALPKNDNETVEMYEDSSGTHKRMEEAKRNAKGDVKEEKEKAGNAISSTTEAAPDTSLAVPKVAVPMQNEDAGKKPYIPNAASAAPKPKTDAELSMEKDAQGLDDEMSKDNVTETQLAKSNEPEFTGALDNKKEAQKQARSAPAEYREQEQPQLSKAEETARAQVFGKMTEMNNARADGFGKVDADKSSTKSKDEQKRKEIADNLQRIYNATKEKVEGILKTLEKEVTDEFDTAANAANAEFEKRVNDRLDDFYGITTADDTIAEWVNGHLDPEIDQIFREERDRFIENINSSIDSIATKVETQLTAAMKAIADGKKDIDVYWNSLGPEMQKLGEAAKNDILGKFDELEQSVNDKYDELIDKLADKYKQNVQALQEKFDKIKESKQGWLSGAINAIRAVIRTILQLKDMLFDTLRRIAQVIGDIISDPIGFFGNLITAVKMGLDNFISNIVTHLKKGFFEWLMGNMPPGIVFPDKWDLTGIFKFIMQILGLTWANIRSRAVKKLGEPVVAALEEVFEIFQIIRKEGLAGLWRYIKEKVGDLKVMVIEAIENFLIEKIVKAGITWIIGLLNPVGAFIKACQAIYKIVMFFIENGKRILEFVNTVIDSIANIVAGNLGGAAKMIEDALARLIPLAIGFLASLLGLDGISEKVQKIIHAIQAPINKAIDWVLDKAIALAKKLGIDKLVKKVKGGIDKGKDWAKKKAEEVKGKAKEIKEKIFEWWKARKGFTNKDGESHTIFFKGSDTNAKLMIASDETDIEKYLNDYPDKTTPEFSAAQAALQAGKQMIFTPATKGKDANRKKDDVIAGLGKISAAFAKLGGGGLKADDYPKNSGPVCPSSPPLSNRVEYLVDKVKKGSTPSQGPNTGTTGWKEVYESGLTKRVDKWVQMHVITEQLGGEGNPQNLVPAPNSVNSGHFKSFERSVLQLVQKKTGNVKNVVWFDVSVNYYDGNIYAQQVSGKAGLHLFKGKKGGKAEWSKDPSPVLQAQATIPSPELHTEKKVSLNLSSGMELRKYIKDETMVKQIKLNRYYTSMGDFATKIETALLNEGQLKHNISKKISSISANENIVLNNPETA